MAGDEPPLGREAAPEPVMRESFRLWNERAFDRLALIFSEDVVYDASAIGDSVIEGRADLRRYFDAVMAVTDFDFAVERIVVRGDRAAVAVALHGRGGHSGAPLLGYLSQLARVRNGAIAEARWFASAEEAEEALPGDRP